MCGIHIPPRPNGTLRKQKRLHSFIHSTTISQMVKIRPPNDVQLRLGLFCRGGGFFWGFGSRSHYLHKKRWRQTWKTKTGLSYSSRLFRENISRKRLGHFFYDRPIVSGVIVFLYGCLGSVLFMLFLPTWHFGLSTKGHYQQGTFSEIPEHVAQEKIIKAATQRTTRIKIEFVVKKIQEHEINALLVMMFNWFN